MDDKEVLMDVCNILLDHNVAIGDGHCLIKRLEAIIANTPEGTTTGDRRMKVYRFRGKIYRKKRVKHVDCKGCTFAGRWGCTALLPDGMGCYDGKGNNWIFEEVLVKGIKG
ncbi:MAG: hypothetical protein WC148_04605 [Bacilli bacterium]